MELLRDLFSLIGRVCVSGVFLWGSYEMIRNWNTSVSYLQSKHIPKVQLLAPVIIGVKIVGSLMVLLGWHAHVGALLLLILAIASVVYLHPFWKMHGNERSVEQARFMKDTAIIGALFLILALGAGHFGLD